jgi:hypothetical protein
MSEYIFKDKIEQVAFSIEDRIDRVQVLGRGEL